MQNLKTLSFADTSLGKSKNVSILSSSYTVPLCGYLCFKCASYKNFIFCLNNTTLTVWAQNVRHQAAAEPNKHCSIESIALTQFPVTGWSLTCGQDMDE